MPDQIEGKAAEGIAAPVPPAAAPPKPAAAKPKKAEANPTKDVDKQRRRMIWACVWGYLGINFLMFLRFFFPRALYEPNPIFSIGYPADFALGIDQRFLMTGRVWVIREPGRIFVIYARCTHLGCTPEWKSAENKFKCPCHGSGYDSEGINFEGPAPRPMDRAHLEIAADGQIEVDVARLYSWPKGQKDHFNDPGAYLSA